MEVLVSTRGVAGGDQTVRQNPEAGKKDVKMIASRLHFRLRRQWAGPGRAPLSWCRGQDRPSYYKLNYRQSRLTWAGPGCGAFQAVPGQERP